MFELTTPIPSSSTYVHVPEDEEKNCTICLNELTVSSWGDSIVAHDNGDGSKHPFHKNCAIGWLKKSSLCAVCRICVDPKDTLLIDDSIEGRNKIVKNVFAICLIVGFIFSQPCSLLFAGSLSNYLAITSAITSISCLSSFILKIHTLIEDPPLINI